MSDDDIRDRCRAVTTGDAEVSELTDEQIALLWRQSALGDPIKRPSRLARFAYAIGREAGLKEAIAVCDKENVGLTGWRAELCAKAIRALIDAPEADSSSAAQGEDRE